MAFYGKKFLEFMRDNKDIPHVSKYHVEDYTSHVMLVVHNVAHLNDRTLTLAAILHDIAKPRTVVVRPGKGATFYGHEKVARKELIQFLSEDDPDFEEVYDIIQAHMLPFAIRGPEPYATDAMKKLDRFIRSNSSATVARLFALNDADSKSKEVIEDDVMVEVLLHILSMADD